MQSLEIVDLATYKLFIVEVPAIDTFWEFVSQIHSHKHSITSAK